jgi:hypothetical protein
VKKEEHDEEMAHELSERVVNAIDGDGNEISVVVGNYNAAR